MASASDEVVELGLIADLDDATAKVFLSDGEAAAAAPAASWPAADQLRSSLVREDAVRQLCELQYYAVPRECTPRCAGGLGPCAPPAAVGGNAICVYAAAFEAGMRFPLHEFYVSVLQHYNLAPSQLTPNAWSYMAGFVRLCDDAGVVPMVSVFRYFFSIFGHSGDSLGWYHFAPCAVTPFADRRLRRRLFAGALPVRMRWRSRFFFLEAPPEMPWPFPSRWGKPRWAAVRRTTLSTMTSDARMAVSLLLQHLDRLGAASTGIDIGRVVFNPNHNLPVAPIIKAEAGRAPVAGGGDTAGVKRKAPAAGTPSPPTTTTRHHHQQHQHQQSFAVTGTPPDQSSSVAAAGNSGGEISLPPPGIWGASDAVELWDAMDAEKAKHQAEMQAASVKIAELQGQLRETKDWNTQLMNYMRTAGAEAAQLKADCAAEVAKLREGHAAEVAELNRKHAAAVTELNQGQAAAVGELTKKLEHEMARVKDAVEEEVLEAKKEIVLALFPGLDASLLERPKLKGDPEKLPA